MSMYVSNIHECYINEHVWPYQHIINVDMLSGSGTFINELMTHDRFINVREHAHVCSAFAFSHYRFVNVREHAHVCSALSFH